MKIIPLLVVIIVLASCGNSTPSSAELITRPTQQDSLFQNLLAITSHNIPDNLQSDSLSFLLLPVQASCPSCRKKTIDSIVKHAIQLPGKHYIIISANGGKKTIRGYFLEQDYELPEVPGRIYLDTVNLGYKTLLYKDKPTFYYCYNRKAYKKVAAIPATVKNDLQEFFSNNSADPN